MQEQQYSGIAMWSIAFIFIGIGLSLLFFDSITIPSRGGARPHHIEGLGVLLIAGLPLSFGSAMILGLIFPKAPKSIGSAILLFGFATFFIGFFF